MEKTGKHVILTMTVLSLLLVAFLPRHASANDTALFSAIDSDSGSSTFNFTAATPVNTTFTANITIKDVDFLGAWQINMTWDRTLLKVNSTDDAVIPTDNIFGGEVDPVGLTIVPGSIYWMAGIKYGAPFEYVNVTIGILCQITFTILRNTTDGPLSCPIHFVLEGENPIYTKLIHYVPDYIPYDTEDGLFVIPEFHMSILLVLFLITTFCALIFSRKTLFDKKITSPHLQ